MKKKKATPHTQLNRLMQTVEQKALLCEIIEPLKDDYRDDFCLACVAYIRFGIRRQFVNPLMDILFTSFCETLDR